MDDVKALFERQAKWQRSRAKLSWTEKLRMAEILRDAALSMKSGSGKTETQADNETKGFKED